MIGADDGRDVGGSLVQPVVERVQEAEGDVGRHLRHLRVRLVDQVHLHGRKHDDLVPGHEHGASHWAEGRALVLKRDCSAAVYEDVKPELEGCELTFMFCHIETRNKSRPNPLPQLF